MKEKISHLLRQAVKSAFSVETEDIKVEYPTEESHGDYSSNIAMHLTKTLSIPPAEIAEKLAKLLKKDKLFKEVSVAGPGFINFFISDEALSAEPETTSNIGKNKKIVIDFSQPNIAKPLGVHHLLSTIIGQSLYNIYKFLGYDPVGINHLGDWGTQFGKLTYAYKNWGDKKKIEKNPIDELLKLYVRFHDEAQADPSLEERAREEFKKLEDGDSENTALWKWFCEVSTSEIQKTYDFLGGIHFDHMQGESFYNDKMDEILEKGKASGVFEKGEGGALVVKFENDKYPPYLVQKSDGATLYSTRDLAAINYRGKTFHPEKILYVVDVAQSLHFQQLFETAKRMKLTGAQLVHVVFGRMQFKDKKMSTRKGNIVLLDEVLKASVEKAGKIIEEKNPDLKDKDKVAHKVGVGAVKYAVLSQNRNTNITFDWDKMLSLEGNSAPYLQYSYARAKSILRKAASSDASAQQSDSNSETSTHIRSLVRLFPRFQEVVLLAAEEYKPNMLANYLHDLAQKFNSFYNSVPVLSSKDREYLLKIVETFSEILKAGLNLLGVEVVEEM
ncbi:MAG: arginine--tRNA ligase [Candidatus Peregrinibacteria bacterium]